MSDAFKNMLDGYVNFYSTTIADGYTDPPPWTKKTWIVADEEEISDILLIWSGLTAMWHAHDLDDHYNFFNDVVRQWDGSSFSIQDEVWDDRPMMSETNLTVVIDDPETARSMFLFEVERLIEERAKAIEEEQEETEVDLDDEEDDD